MVRWPQALCVVQDREELVQRRGVVKEAELFGPGTKARLTYEYDSLAQRRIQSAAHHVGNAGLHVLA